ncbi:MAG TPA: thiamine phosphate synthase [Candidatus Blautia intestinipullorum]|nr:thiamine phosphate synthase [Candidatus Blautia intestinipullorum]
MKFTKDEIRRAMLLYAITDRSWLKQGETLTDVCREVLENGATFLQIREKDLDEKNFEKEAAELKSLCEKYRVPFVVNDNVQIALDIDADGVHVGQSDIKGRDIRSLIGPDKILGISAGTVEEAIAAEKAGADYIGVGAVFGTSTKKDARNLSIEKLREICGAVAIPAVAIGGIGRRNVRELDGSGASGIAVISAIFGAGEPGKATGELLKLAEEMVKKNG